jgi:predicted CoA-substrate-specific enzyme activase
MRVPLFCSLIPGELIAACGYELHPLKAEEIASCAHGGHHCALHENLCSYGKALCDYFARRHADYDLIVVPAACDAQKKLFNALRAAAPADRVILLDVPKNTDDAACRFLAANLARLRDRLLQGMTEPREGGSPLDVPIASAPRRGTTVGILGANAPLASLEEHLRQQAVDVIYLNHCLVKASPDPHLAEILRCDGIARYAGEFLRRNSCPRTNDAAVRANIIGRVQEEAIDGVILNTVKFCDFQPFDYRELKRSLGQAYPIVQVEHEFGSQAEGQMWTRVEAFLEKMRGVRVASSAREQPSAGPHYYVGIDSGSHATKLVCIDADGAVVAQFLVPTGTCVGGSSGALMERLVAEAGVCRSEIASIVGTGYGRSTIEGCDATVTEISCHALGAHTQLHHAATLIDVGGQDSKAIRIDGEGNVVRFAMNDKCAAGTGRFLEVMAQKLELSLSAFAALAQGSPTSVPISSMCSVFAESEVISLIAAGKPREGIARGVHEAIAERTASLCKRISGEPPYVMAGGVAKNTALVAALSACLGAEVTVLRDPQFSGALGAALMALRNCS